MPVLSRRAALDSRYTRQRCCVIFDDHQEGLWSARGDAALNVSQPLRKSHLRRALVWTEHRPLLAGSEFIAHEPDINPQSECRMGASEGELRDERETTKDRSRSRFP